MVLGYIDPDLVTAQRDSPASSSRARQVRYAIASAMCWPLYRGDVKCAFLQGETCETVRQVYGRPPPELLA